VGTVMSRLFRGRKLLQKTLRDYAMGAGVLSAEAERVPASRIASEATSLEDYRRRRAG
jgi:RNA polymerase sigma-70 factor (ECF subfamily)